ncbi:hypothetical protein ACHHRT_09365 [Desulfurivibrio sp. D14AmB]|uniref:hypothetical protein n=1 Tax=Desulfurivibrio sp. D14AmB TaxID=3374370 RepID=UPI00376F0881
MPARILLIPLSSPRGSILLSLIGTIVVVALLAAGVVSLIGSAGMAEVHANQAARAYYLAESGLRYVVSEFRGHAGADYSALEEKYNDPDQQHFSLPGGTLRIYDLKVSGGVAGQLGSDPQLVAPTGYLVLEGVEAELDAFPRYNGVVAFAEPLAGVAAPRYRYRRSERVAGDLRLFDLRPLDGPALPFLFPAEAVVTLEPMLTFKSRGVAGWARRTLTYSLPLGGGGLAGGPDFEDSGDFDLTHWAGGPGKEGKSLGVFAYDGTAQAIVVERVQSGHSVASLQFEPKDEAGQPISIITRPDYEVQVKIKLAADLFTFADQTGKPGEIPDDYMVGITFRMHGDHKLAQVRGYGLSLVRWDAAAEPAKSYHRLPEAVVPASYRQGGINANQPFLALWKSGDGPADGFQKPDNLQLLAWAPAVGTADAAGLLKEWLTLVLRVEQLGEEGGEFNRVTAFYGEGQQRLAVGGGILWPAAGLEQLDPAEFTLFRWSGQAGGAARGENNSYVDTAVGQYLFETTSGLEVGLHAWGENLENRAWFSEFAVRLGGGGRELPGFVPPVQE